MTIGIYKLEFKDGSFYIGKSVNIESRYKDHKSQLLRNKSGSPKLQRKYNEVQSLPSMSIIEECSIDLLSEREVFWIDTTNATTNGLNVLHGGQDTMVGDKHPGSKYSNSKIHYVMELLSQESPVLTHIQIQELTGVKSTTVKDIVCGISHTWLKEEYPETYAKMMDVKAHRKNINSIANLNPQANKKTLVYPTIVSPDGIEYIIEHLSNFANEHGLQPSNLSHVLSGRRTHTKGWKLKCK